MSKLINITELLSSEKPCIQIGEKSYPVNDGVDAVIAFEEAASQGARGMITALEAALGKNAYKEIGVGTFSLSNLRVLATAVLAAQAGLSYEEAEARFQRSADATE
ncbi:hypothetical protein V3851_26030 [Paenibacillus sp. M1]|uniref:Uncharacterized protein n=1 Tax=Paenibacillus haidiansis TaxID=1574488 RepID=A0ABU7VZX5_9BACL